MGQEQGFGVLAMEGLTGASAGFLFQFPEVMNSLRLNFSLAVAALRALRVFGCFMQIKRCVPTGQLSSGLVAEYHPASFAWFSFLPLSSGQKSLAGA